jgi:hypothetical protein
MMGTVVEIILRLLLYLFVEVVRLLTGDLVLYIHSFGRIRPVSPQPFNTSDTPRRGHTLAVIAGTGAWVFIVGMAIAILAVQR